MTTALLPCPFCGDAMKFEHGEGSLVVHIAGSGACPLIASHFAPDEWNRRAAPPQDRPTLNSLAWQLIDACGGDPDAAKSAVRNAWHDGRAARRDA